MLTVLALVALALVALAAAAAVARRRRRFAPLRAGWRAIAAEAASVRLPAGGAKIRRKTDWAEGLQAFVGKLGGNEEWVYAWARDGSWLNYPLWAGGRVVPGRTRDVCPAACAALESVGGVEVAGLSMVRAGGRIEPHTDGGAGHSHGRMALHLCLTGRSWLRVGRRWFLQRPGRLITFDPEVEHEVVNRGTADRVLLYVNLQRRP